MGEDDKKPALRHLCRTDLFYLLRVACKRDDVDREWLYRRCCEVESAPNNHLDLWSREHYKSTIITFGKTIQDILASHGDDPIVDREITVGIFSHTRPIAKAFLRQIKFELESNETLADLFPDILWENPRAQAPKWSEDDGLIVRRKSNPKEATLEAWGVVDGQPTGKHFDVLVYDDIVTRESVTTPDMIRKTTEALELSYNLGADGGVRRFIGTRYHFNDTYRTLMERGTAKPRIYPATKDGKIEGEPVLLSRKVLNEKRRDMGPYTFGCQMMQNPIADSTQGFQKRWVKYYDDSSESDRLSMARGQTVYFLVDAANAKKKTSDYTAIFVVGLGADRNRYVLDIIRDRLNLTERGALIMKLHRKWKPFDVRYERYGLMADVQYIEELQRQENYRFAITEVGGKTPKNDRIKRMIPVFEKGQYYFPRELLKQDHEGKLHDLVASFLEEYEAFPVPVTDDMLDSLARLDEPDLPLVWPSENSGEIEYPSLGII